MKRIFTYLSMAAAIFAGLASCQVDKEATDPTPVVPACNVDITISDVEDYAFTVTIAPQGESSFYSYLVAPGSVKSLDSLLLYQGKYSSIAQGVVEYDKNAQISFEIEAEPNSVYTVYAVAASIPGNVGSIATKTVKTSDKVAPEIVEFSSLENIVAIAFSEDVVLAKDAKITSKVCYKCYLNGNPYKNEVEASKVQIIGSVAYITFEDIVKPGAYYTVNYAEGTFTDVAGNPAAALVSSFDSEYDFSKDEFEYTGVYGYLDNADLVYELPEYNTTVLFTDFSTLKYSVNIPEGISRIDLKDSYVTTYTRTSETESSSSVTVETVPMSKLTNYYGTYYDVVVIPAGTPQGNDKMTITIPAGAVRDWWGNVNAKDIVLGPVTLASPAAEIEPVSAAANSVSFNVTPNTSSLYWIYDVTAKADYTTDAELVKAYVDEIAYYAGEDNCTFEEEMATYYAYTGAEKELGAYNLDQQTDYVISVFFLDKDGNLLGDVSHKEFTTAKFAFPEGISTGSYTYTGSFKQNFGTQAGLPVTFDAATGALTISSWLGGYCTLKATFDESGNGKITTLKTPFAFGSYGNIYAFEYNNYAGSGYLSYIDDVNKCICFHIVYAVSAGYLSYGWEYFDLDNSSAASPSANSCKMTPVVEAAKAPISKSLLRKAHGRK